MCPWRLVYQRHWKLVDITDRCFNTIKRSIFENDVDVLAEFRNVKTTDA